MKAGLLLTFFVVLFSLNVAAQEICNNAIDDDLDGLVDLNDTTDCKCNGISGTTTVTSMIPNPSFEVRNCCPTGYSQMNCATGWIQASDATSDYLNTCDYVPQAAVFANLIPFPHGTGIVGTHVLQDYKEYVGACLLQPMIAGQSYTIQMNMASTPADGNLDTCNGGVIYYSPLDVTIFGSTSCANMPFPGDDCPPATWQSLGSVTYTPSSTWSMVTITFVPSVNINAIILGPPCTIPNDYNFNTGNCSQYFYYDNLLLNTTSSFSHIAMHTNGAPCQNNVVLESHTDTAGGTWQWYLNGVALAGATDSVLNVSANNYGQGMYTVMYSIGNSCDIQRDSVVSNQPDVTISNFTNANCNGVNDGNATASVTGGTGAITYSWNTNPVQNTSVANNLPGGYFTVTVTDSQGCTDTTSVNITQGQTYSVANPQSICNGESYVFNSHTYSSAGTYYDTLTTIAGCDSIIETQLALISAYVINNPQTICAGETYYVNGHGYNSAGTYYDSLQTGAGCDSVIITQMNVNPVLTVNNPQTICTGNSYTINSHTYTSPGTYFDTLQTSNGCDSIITTQLTQNPVYTINNPQSICSGGSYSINGNTYSTTGNYNDLFQSANGCDSLVITQLVVNPPFHVNNSQTICEGETYSINSHSYNSPGNYYDTLFSVAGCDSVVQTDLIVNPVPQVTFSDPGNLCVDAGVLPLTQATPPGGIYSGEGVNNDIFNPAVAKPGVHVIQYTYADSITNCASTVDRSITVFPLPDVNFDLNPRETYLNGPGIYFKDFTSGAQYWYWEFGDSTTSVVDRGIHKYADTGSYRITLFVIDDHGCRNFASQDVTVGLDFSFYVPNAFTPNGDGKNETFNGVGVGIGSYEMTIFNRWGESVFHTNNIQHAWNGKDAPGDTYVYKINVADLVGHSYEYVGRVTIVR